VRWVVGNRYLRAVAACTATSNFFNSVSFSIFVLYAVRVLHLSSVRVGVVFACGSVGAVLGALVVNRLQRRITVGWTIVGGSVMFSAGGLAFPLAPRSFPLPVLIAGFFVAQFGGLVYNIAQVSFRQAITPERLQGRMNAAMRWIVWGTIPLGTLLGGVLGSTVGLHFALWVGALGGLVAFLFVALSPVRSIVSLPEPLSAVGEPDETALPPHLD
jgi:MFS family permease